MSSGADESPRDRRLSWRWGLLGLLALAAGLAVAVAAAKAGWALYVELAAPDSFLPARSAMVGTWRSADGAVLVLRQDGTFTERGLPGDAGESRGGTIPPAGTGIWHRGTTGAEPPGIVFIFSANSANAEMELLFERYRWTTIMFYDKGDPDEGTPNQYQFTKTQSVRAGDGGPSRPAVSWAACSPAGR